MITSQLRKGMRNPRRSSVSRSAHGSSFLVACARWTISCWRAERSFDATRSCEYSGMWYGCIGWPFQRRRPSGCPPAVRSLSLAANRVRECSHTPLACCVSDLTLGRPPARVRPKFGPSDTIRNGEVSEWFMVPLSKSGVQQCTGGSNPSLSARSENSRRRHTMREARQQCWRASATPSCTTSPAALGAVRTMARSFRMR